MKFVCPKMKWVWDKKRKRSYRKCECKNPCITSSCGRMIYVYPEQNLRAYPGTTRDNEEWDATYKIRVNVEKYYLFLIFLIRSIAVILFLSTHSSPQKQSHIYIFCQPVLPSQVGMRHIAFLLSGLMRKQLFLLKMLLFWYSTP